MTFADNTNGPNAFVTSSQQQNWVVDIADAIAVARAPPAFDGGAVAGEADDVLDDHARAPDDVDHPGDNRNDEEVADRCPWFSPSHQQLNFRVDVAFARVTPVA